MDGVKVFLSLLKPKDPI